MQLDYGGRIADGGSLILRNNGKALGKERLGLTPLLVDVPLLPTCPTTCVGSPILIIDTT